MLVSQTFPYRITYQKLNFQTNDKAYKRQKSYDISHIYISHLKANCSEEIKQERPGIPFKVLSKWEKRFNLFYVITRESPCKGWIYNPSQNSLGHFTKCQLAKYYFEMGSRYSIFRAPPPPPPHQPQNYDEGGEGEVHRKTICWQKWSIPRLLTKTVGVFVWHMKQNLLTSF